MQKQFLSVLIGLVLFLPLQAQIDNFFNSANSFFSENVESGRVDYDNIQNDKEGLMSLISQVADMNLSGIDDDSKQAFYINAYNLLVIRQVMLSYPLNSVQEVNGFFDSKKFKVAGELLTLNQIEKDKLLKVYNDPRYHFALVCGAVGCPPIIAEAYLPSTLDAQLERQTRLALNDPNFIRWNVDKNKAEVSEIFNWYAKDFGSSKSNVISFINGYRSSDIPSNAGLGYYTYDWTLNKVIAGGSKTSSTSSPITTSGGAGNSANRYVVSAAIPKGTIETKIFNNLYSQRTTSNGVKTDRTSFFTTFITSLYGVSNRFNAGIEARYRRVRNEALPASPFDVLGGAEGEGVTSRDGFTTIGPKIRWAPVPKWKNFSIQSAFWFTLADDLEGTDTEPYIDWNKPTWWTQFFNDFTINDNFSFFTEIDFLWEDIGGDDGDLNRVSTPVTGIFSYFPNSKTTLYLLGGYSPYWQEDYDYFAQGGLGAKYQFTRNFELEVSYNLFTNEFLSDTNGDAQTINMGIRFNL